MADEGQLGREYPPRSEAGPGTPDGPDLRRHLADRGGRLPAAEAAGIAAQAASALAAAHAHDVIHLNLEPGNIILVRNGDTTQIKINGFGQAKPSTATEYAAPELTGSGRPTAAADVYSLGLITA